LWKIPQAGLGSRIRSILSRPHLAVIVPAYNEESRLQPTLARIEAYLAGRPFTWRVAVVDDGSTDGTARIARSFAEAHPRFSLIEMGRNRGKGAAVRTGMLRVEASLLLFSDADLATPIEELEKLLSAVEAGAAIAIGSRPLRESRLEVRQPLYREYLGRSFNMIVQLLAVRGISDTQCGFKLFTLEAARAVFARCKLDGFGFDFEALMIARDLGLVIAEVPIRWRHQEGSKVRLLRDGTRMFADLVRLRLQGRRRRLEPRRAEPHAE
jgi:dolichyl-phosphate beta-glucosyltransferase